MTSEKIKTCVLETTLLLTCLCYKLRLDDVTTWIESRDELDSINHSRPYFLNLRVMMGRAYFHNKEDWLNLRVIRGRAYCHNKDDMGTFVSVI